MNKKILNIIKKTAIEAGDILLSYFGKLKKDQISYKNPVDLVTEADRVSEQFIKKRLHRYFPSSSFYGEEEGLSGQRDAELLFIVDPLDGTTNFVHTHPFFSISIACIKDKVPVCGIVFAPVIKMLYEAIQKNGAKLNQKPIRVSKTSEINQSLLITGFACVRQRLKPDGIKLFNRLIYSAQGIRRSGSAAIDLCFVADGKADLFWEIGLNPWDTAAGALIVKEAGGRVSDFKGKPYFENKKTIVASNGIIHDEFIKIVKETDRRYLSI